MIQEKPMHQQKVCFRALFVQPVCLDGIFFLNCDVTVNVIMLYFLWNKSDTINLEDMWFQQDGGRVISRNGDFFSSKTILQLKKKIRSAFGEIELNLCENFAKKMFSCQRSLNGYLADIVFRAMFEFYFEIINRKKKSIKNLNYVMEVSYNCF